MCNFASFLAVQVTLSSQIAARSSMVSDQIQFPIYKLSTLPDKLPQMRTNTQNNTF